MDSRQIAIEALKQSQALLASLIATHKDSAQLVQQLTDNAIAISTLEADMAQVEPPFSSARAAALALYQPPFHYKYGYIFDANNLMVSDDSGVKDHIAQRVRGWGRIGDMPAAAELQDEIGAVIAEALTQFWVTVKGATP